MPNDPMDERDLYSHPRIPAEAEMMIALGVVNALAPLYTAKDSDKLMDHVFTVVDATMKRLRERDAQRAKSTAPGA